MPMSPESWLMTILAGLYVYDSTLRLERNEALLTRTLGGRWQALFSWRAGSVFGKELALPNLLTPGRPLLRLRWRFEAPRDAAPHAWDAVSVGLDALAAPIAGLFTTLFVALPAVLWLGLGDAATLLVFGLIYLHLLVIGVLLWRRRERLGLARRQLGGMLFEFLLCPPFALNAVRRLTLARPVDEDFFVAARRLLSPGDFVEVCAAIGPRLDDEIAAEDEGTPRMAVLLERRAQIDRLAQPAHTD